MSEEMTLQQAVTRWRGPVIRGKHGPEVPSYRRMQELAGEVEELQAEQAELKQAHTQAVAQGEPFDTSRLVTIEAEIEARQGTVPFLWRRAVAEWIDMLEQQTAELQERQAKVRATVPDLEAAYQQANAKAKEAHAAWSAAVREAHFCSGDVADNRAALRRLAQKLAAES